MSGSKVGDASRFTQLLVSLIDRPSKSVHELYMATKTISVDIEAYTRLSGARLFAKESFSQVIKRARWSRQAKTGGDLLKALPNMPRASESVIRRLQNAQEPCAIF